LGILRSLPLVQDRARGVTFAADALLVATSITNFEVLSMSSDLAILSLIRPRIPPVD